VLDFREEKREGRKTPEPMNESRLNTSTNLFIDFCIFLPSLLVKSTLSTLVNY
jgi:hypothetical protein